MSLIETHYSFAGITSVIRTNHLRTMLWRLRELLALERGDAKYWQKTKQGKRMQYVSLPGAMAKEMIEEAILKLENLITEREEEERNGRRDMRLLP